VTVGCQDGLPLVLFVQLTVSFSSHRERCREDKPVDVEVSFEMSFALTQFECLEVRLHEGDLNVNFLRIQSRNVNHIRVLDYDDSFRAKTAHVKPLKAVKNLRKLREWRLLVDVLILIQVAELRAVETDTEIRGKDTLATQLCDSIESFLQLSVDFGQFLELPVDDETKMIKSVRDAR
jgi:hypothetical protein